MENKKIQVPWYGYVVLIVTILILSGFFNMFEGPLQALDFTSMIGKWGEVAAPDGSVTTYRGVGGYGAREAMLFILSLAPAVSVAFAIIEVATNYDGLLAAEKLLTPVMKPLLGLGGAAALSMVASFTSADAGAGTARELRDLDYISERQHIIFTAFQFSAPALVVNYFSLGTAAMPFVTINPSLILLVIIVMKYVGANLLRLYLNTVKGKESLE